jgi:hypothetical protein
MNQMSRIGNGYQSDRRSIKGTSSLSSSGFGLLGTSFIVAFSFFVIVFATWFIEKVSDFGLSHLFVLCYWSFVLGYLFFANNYSSPNFHLPSPLLFLSYIFLNIFSTVCF